MLYKKNFFIFLFFIFSVLSCEDTENQGFGNLTINFNQQSQNEETNSSPTLSSKLYQNNNTLNQTLSSVNDVDTIRVKVGSSDPVVVSIVNGSASYSKSNLPEGSISISIELLGSGEIKYIQSKSVTIIANQNASTTFNNFAVINQQLSWTSALESSYDVGDEIDLSWENSHSEQPVDIERWDFIGSAWVKSSTLAQNWNGNSGVWPTQGEPQGDNVKIRIQSKVSSIFIDSPSFSLTGGSDQSVSNVQYSGISQLSSGPTLIISWDVMSITFDGASSENQNFDIFYVASDGNGRASIAQNYNYHENGEYLWSPGTNVFKAEDGEGWFRSGKTIEVCVASTNICSNSPAFRASGWDGGGFTRSNLDITKISDGGTGDKFLFFASSSTFVTVSTSGGSGDVDIFLDELLNINTSSSSFNTIASSENSGNSDSINWTGTTNASFLMIILRPYSNVQGVTLNSNGGSRTITPSKINKEINLTEIN
jgi:hypothetical protein